jgi:hypothetical protein
MAINPENEFDWNAPVGWNASRKEVWHAKARARLHALAAVLKLKHGTYSIRSNKAGPAVSGEVTLHGDWIFVQVSQPTNSLDGLLIRSCKGQADFTGGRNNNAPLALLDEPGQLAARITALGIMPAVTAS